MTWFLTALAIFIVPILDELSAQTFADHIKDGREYKLEKIGAQTPKRAMHFTFFENPTYTAWPAMMICGECFCVTGVFKGKYPEMGFRGTSASPTHRCAQESVEFEQDAELAKKFMEMTRIEAKDTVLIFSAASNEYMLFRMRTDMESCLNLFELEGELAARNRCGDPVEFQLHVPAVQETLVMNIAAGMTLTTGLNYTETDDYTFSACPVKTEPTVPFDERGFARIRAREYECR